MSFDLEQSPQPKRRKRKTELANEQPPEFTPSEHGIDCPGCGSNMDENEWLQALVGFVSGARDFEVGNPVRARIVQTLHNTATNMDTPHPRDVWDDLTEISVSLRYDWARVETAGPSAATVGGGQEFFKV